MGMEDPKLDIIRPKGGPVAPSGGWDPPSPRKVKFFQRHENQGREKFFPSHSCLFFLQFSRNTCALEK